MSAVLAGFGQKERARHIPAVHDQSAHADGSAAYVRDERYSLPAEDVRDHGSDGGLAVRARDGGDEIDLFRDAREELVAFERGYAESRRPHERGVVRRHRRGTDDEVAPLYDIRVIVLANAGAEGGKQRLIALLRDWLA